MALGKHLGMFDQRTTISDEPMSEEEWSKRYVLCVPKNQILQYW